MVGGFRFDGVFQDDPVHVFDVKAHAKGANIGAAYVQDLVDVCGAGLGERCFIVAPALSVDLYEDYIDVAGTRFFFLRIPYSVIAELHRRSFSELRQAKSSDTLNALIDSVGFDFIQPPHVELRLTEEGSYGVVKLVDFESEAYSAGPSSSNMQDLAMVLVDLAYDGDIFDVDLVAYSEELSKSGYEIRLPLETAGELLMLVFVDVYGNELKQVVQPREFVGGQEAV